MAAAPSTGSYGEGAAGNPPDPAATAAALAHLPASFVPDPSSGYLYSTELGYYYDPVTGLYGSASTGLWGSSMEAAVGAAAGQDVAKWEGAEGHLVGSGPMHVSQAPAVQGEG